MGSSGGLLLFTPFKGTLLSPPITHYRENFRFSWFQELLKLLRIGPGYFKKFMVNGTKRQVYLVGKSF